ncbi:Nonaspanin [Parasponia andersonii]|uniref:Transmembrane 9 superfamily member n=1 Tax=Parasponia andersonii TaxID=3476 RepID=A0A2P5E122_PARAD|nr:Nonaspanin [Parasponia andersonii]
MMKTTATELETMLLYVVGPFENPSETYRYFDLPFCQPQPENLKEKKQTLGELLSGDHLFKAPYQLEFLVDKDSELLVL